MGEFRAAEPFFSTAWFPGRSALEETPPLTVPRARTLPLPAQSAGARLPLRPQLQTAAAGAFRMAPGAPQAWRSEAIDSSWPL